MPNGFYWIQEYLKAEEPTYDLEEMPDSENQIQQNVTTATDALVPVSVKTETGLIPYDFDGQYFHEDISLPIPAPSAGCATLTAVPEPPSGAGTSPPHLLDMDSLFQPDITMYDQDPMVKQEPQEHSISGQLDGEMDDSLKVLCDATKEIPEECAHLQIGPDPSQWSREEVARWVYHMCQKYGISECSINFDELATLDGRLLSRMSPEDFSRLAWPGGENLCLQLVIWQQSCSLNEDTSRYVPASPVAETPVRCHTLERQTPSPCSLSPGSPGSSSSQSQESFTCQTSGTFSALTLEESVLRYKTNFERVQSTSEMRKTSDNKQIHLWQFLKELLQNPQSFSGCIKWLDRTKGIFKIEDSGRVAKEWGRRKSRPLMNYDKLSRSIRQYYKKGIIKKTEHSKRLVYQFCAPYL